MQRACQKFDAWHGSCSSFLVARSENNLGRRERGVSGARLVIATPLVDVTRKQRFGSNPAVSPVKLRVIAHTAPLASWAVRPGTHLPNSRGFEAPACGHTSFDVTPDSGEPHVKRTVCEKTTRWNPASAAGISFLPSAVGRGQRSHAKKYAGTHAQAEAYLLLKRCCRVWEIERGACRVVRLAIESGVRRTPMRNAPRRFGKAYANAWSSRVSVRFALPCAPDSRAPRRLRPPSDAGPGVVAFAARALCADRAWSRGSLRRPTKALWPNSSATTFHLLRDGTGRASIVPVGQGRHFSLTRAGSTVTPASGFMGKQWHTR